MLLDNVSVQMLGVQQEQVVGLDGARSTQSRIAFASQHVVAIDGRYARMLLHKHEYDACASVGQTLPCCHQFVELSNVQVVIVVVLLLLILPDEIDPRGALHLLLLPVRLVPVQVVEDHHETRHFVQVLAEPVGLEYAFGYIKVEWSLRVVCNNNNNNKKYYLNVE